MCIGAGGQAWTTCSFQLVSGGHAQGPANAQTVIPGLGPTLCTRGCRQEQYRRSSPTDASPSGASGGAYGDTARDAGDQVRLSVELTHIDRLKDTYALDIRHLKGNLRSYKFLYDAIKQRVCFTCVL